MIKRIYRAQQENPVKGDWCELVIKDLQDLNMSVNEVDIISMNNYKEKVKENIKRLALYDLKELKKPHPKINQIVYSSLSAQPYIKNHIINNEEISILFSLRCRTVRTIKGNFSKMFNGQVQCQLGCTTEETQ